MSVLLKEQSSSMVWATAKNDDERFWEILLYMFFYCIFNQYSGLVCMTASKSLNVGYLTPGVGEKGAVWGTRREDVWESKDVEFVLATSIFFHLSLTLQLPLLMPLFPLCLFPQSHFLGGSVFFSHSFLSIFLSLIDINSYLLLFCHSVCVILISLSWWPQLSASFSISLSLIVIPFTEKKTNKQKRQSSATNCAKWLTLHRSW